MYLACPGTTSFPAICRTAFQLLVPTKNEIVVVFFGSALIRIRFGSWKVRRLNWALKTKFKVSQWKKQWSKNRKHAGYDGEREKPGFFSFPFPLSPARFLFPFLQPPYDTKRPLRKRERTSCFWGCKSVRYFECIQTKTSLKWIAGVSSRGIALWF